MYVDILILALENGILKSIGLDAIKEESQIGNEGVTEKVKKPMLYKKIISSRISYYTQEAIKKIKETINRISAQC